MKYFFIFLIYVGKTASPIITAIINIIERTTVAIGPTLTPLDSSSKNRINPAPANGIGPSRPRRLDRLDFFFDILNHNNNLVSKSYKLISP